MAHDMKEVFSEFIWYRTYVTIDTNVKQKGGRPWVSNLCQRLLTQEAPSAARYLKSRDKRKYNTCGLSSSELESIIIKKMSSKVLSCLIS